MTDLFTEATHDPIAESFREKLAQASEALAPKFAHLSEAQTVESYEDRKANIAPSVERVIAAVTDGDPALFATVHEAVLTQWDADFAAVLDHRRERQARQANRRGFERRQARRIQANLLPFFVSSGTSEYLGQIMSVIPQELRPDPDMFVIDGQYTRWFGRLNGRTVHRWGQPNPSVDVFEIETVADADGSLWGDPGERVRGSFCVNPDAVHAIQNNIRRSSSASRKQASEMESWHGDTWSIIWQGPYAGSFVWSVYRSESAMIDNEPVESGWVEAPYDEGKADAIKLVNDALRRHGLPGAPIRLSERPQGSSVRYMGAKTAGGSQAEIDAWFDRVVSDDYKEMLAPLKPYMVYGPQYRRGITEKIADVFRHGPPNEYEHSVLEALVALNLRDEQWRYDQGQGRYVPPHMATKTASPYVGEWNSRTYGSVTTWTTDVEDLTCVVEGSDGTPGYEWFVYGRGSSHRHGDTPESSGTATTVREAQDAAIDYATRLYNRKNSMRKGAPFAGYDDFADCVSKNSDKDDPESYCGSIKNKVEGGKTALTFSQSAPEHFMADYEKFTEALKPYVTSFPDGSQGISPDAPEGLTRPYMKLQQMGYANGYFASRKMAKVRDMDMVASAYQELTGRDLYEDFSPQTAWKIAKDKVGKDAPAPGFPKGSQAFNIATWFTFKGREGALASGWDRHDPRYYDDFLTDDDASDNAVASPEETEGAMAAMETHGEWTGVVAEGVAITALQHEGLVHWAVTDEQGEDEHDSGSASTVRDALEEAWDALNRVLEKQPPPSDAVAEKVEDAADEVADAADNVANDDRVETDPDETVPEENPDDTPAEEAEGEDPEDEPGDEPEPDDDDDVDLDAEFEPGDDTDPEDVVDAAEDGSHGDMTNVDPKSMGTGDRVNMVYTLADGTTGNVDVTFVREENDVYFFDGPSGEFGIGDRDGEWVDSDGNHFAFSDGDAVEEVTGDDSPDIDLDADLEDKAAVIKEAMLAEDPGLDPRQAEVLARRAARLGAMLQ